MNRVLARARAAQQSGEHRARAAQQSGEHRARDAGARDAGEATKRSPAATRSGPAPPGTGRARHRRIASAASDLGAARLALAAVLGLRLALSPFAAAVGQPDALWRPIGTAHLFPVPPPVALVVALQVVGVAGALAYVALRRRHAVGRGPERVAPLVIAWACLLLLAGLRTSLGKVLHNDVLLLVASAPLLLAGPDPDDDDARTGLDGAAAIVIVSYLAAFWWKLLRTGPAWALSDNLRWALAEGRGGARWLALSEWLVARPPACVALACAIVALELGSALVWLRPRVAPWFVAGAAAMHAGTWLVLGLDYWAHLAAVALVLAPWARMRRR